MKHPKTSRCFRFSCGRAGEVARAGHERCSRTSGPGHFSRRQGQWQNPCCKFLLLRIETFLCLISISSFAREGGVEAAHSLSSPCLGSEFHQECFKGPLCVSRPPLVCFKAPLKRSLLWGLPRSLGAHDVAAP